ncbi:LRR receptor-like serine threonine-protein kinase At4g08850 [Seminavis robusta]|uniref:LRR receptor-like serine threonine-protein kinase At4g08850 n=1 Tax=Seminavis robusta TaxID=568900 RepID=A0A9N8DJA4_9STRA|nr:LRR receptor-like serine threonine-protein kinase At4g08850 [Seminavis robusta]|eukprot:Sro118_g057570.1 LRR receptor-like serine threonine-protein kinase At4g08850 (633) ;mRNA; f:3704-6264
MSPNNNSDNEDVDLLKIVEWRLQQGSAENCQEEEETSAASDTAPSSYSASTPPTCSSPTATVAALAPPLPPTTTCGSESMKIVRERTLDAAAACHESAGDLELVEVAEKESDNHHHDRTILRRQPGHSCRQLQWIPGAYAIDGPFLANNDTEENHHPNTGVSSDDDEDLDNWDQEQTEDIIANPIDDDQQIGLLPNADPIIPTNQRARKKHWRKMLLCSLSVEINVALLVVSVVLVIFLVVSREQGNNNQSPHQNGASQISTNPDLCCNEMGEIKALAFAIANNMEGTIPPEISFLGKSLQHLILSRQQQLRGSIPTELGELTQLTELELGATGISGTIPRELGLLMNLGQLSLSGNNLLGSLPSELGKLYNLTIFRLSEAELTGSLPTEFYQWHKLEILDVFECPKLNTEFVLSEIAENFQQLRLITLVQRASGDKMPIPSHLGKLPNLTFLSLNRWNISGTIPSTFVDLVLLHTLDLENNTISGTFPQLLFKLTNMVHLFLGSNNLEGKLPLSLFSHLTQLRQLSLRDNQFSGTVPTEVGLLSSLKKLEIQNTNLSGTLPTELLQLENLTSLVVTNTSLWGSIPEKLCGKMHQQTMSGIFGGVWVQQKSETPVCQGTLLCGCDCDPCPAD